FLHDICFFYRASLGGPDERREQKFATLVGDHFGMSPTNILLTQKIRDKTLVMMIFRNNRQIKSHSKIAKFVENIFFPLDFVLQFE
ncbi:hypothetical protein, partial [Anoxybacillus flavithermus]|uniref:hypothetical protein n=1 Tax=Anoxybacillus flavithermus TaxID=33934 RepID=UPI003B987724